MRQHLLTSSCGWRGVPAPPFPRICGAIKAVAKPICSKPSHSILNNRGPKWVGWTNPWEVLLLDDVQQFSAIQQHMAFNWFVNATTPGAGRQPWVLAAGSLPPQDLPLREDLRSRLGWGHVFQLHLLDDAQRREVLLNHAQALGLQLGRELLDYLLSRFSRDLGHLISLLEQLDHYALQTQRPLTIPLLRAMLDET